MNTTKHDKLKPFHFHGVDIDDGTKTAQGDCPFCDKPGHFYVKTQNGQWNCRRCDEGGNISTFLVRLLYYSKKATTAKAYRELEAARGIPVAVMKEWGVVQSFITGDWLIPAYNEKGKLSNVFKYTRISPKGKPAVWRLYSSPGCKLHPMGIDLLIKRKKTGMVWVAEGPWDAMAIHAALGQVKQNGNRMVRVAAYVTANPGAGKGTMIETHAVIASPGSGTFNAGWLQYIDGVGCRICFDNDWPKKNPKTGKITKPGWDGTKRIVKMAGDDSRIPSSLYQMRWGKAGYDKARPDGFDMRDLLSTEGPVKGLKTALKLCERVKIKRTGKTTGGDDTSFEETLEPLHRASFGALVKDFESVLHFTGPLRDTLLVMLATVLSTSLKTTDQLWFRIIGPPGSGKSTLAEAISAAKDYVFPVSLQTGFHSGYVVPGKKAKDTSLIPDMMGKTTIIKDGDCLINSPNRDRILSEMRDFYDGVSRSRYRNNVTRIYEDIQTTFIICGTDSMRALNRTFLGERFLDCEILGDAEHSEYLSRSRTNTMDNIARALKKNGEDKDNLSEDQTTFLKRTTMGFIHYLKNKLDEGGMVMPTMDKETEDRIEAIGQFLSFMRAKVERTGTDMAYRPRAELATRLVGQFTKLAVTIALVLSKKKIDSEVMRVVKMVLTTTCEGFQYEATTLLWRYKKAGLSAKQVEMELRLSEGSARRLLQDMREFDIVERIGESNRSGQRGRNRHVFRLSEKIIALHTVALGPRRKK